MYVIYAQLLSFASFNWLLCGNRQFYPSTVLLDSVLPVALATLNPWVKYQDQAAAIRQISVKRCSTTDNVSMSDDNSTRIQHTSANRLNLSKWSKRRFRVEPSFPQFLSHTRPCSTPSFQLLLPSLRLRADASPLAVEAKNLLPENLNFYRLLWSSCG